MRLVITFIVFGLSLLLSACSSNTDTPSKTMAQLVTDEDQFLALEDALDRTGLLTTLEGEGPFTVFAPTNEAFASIGTDPGEENLRQLLLYHVVAQKLEGKDITGSGTLPTLQGTDLSYTVTGSEVTLTDSRGNQVKVTQTDIQATNGVIHVIEAVLLLPDIPAPVPEVR
jgi:transforming growth factor-beta-induced protein